MKVLQYIPGFRTKTKWKMAVAVLYYLFALFMFAGGFWMGLFFLSCPFFAFALIDVIKRKSAGKQLITLLVALALMVTSTAAIASQEPQDTSQKQSVATQTQEKKTSHSDDKQKADVSSKSENKDQNQEKTSLATSQSQSQAAKNEHEKETPVSLVAVQVTKVVDGDTFYARFSNGQEKKVRLIGVDTPESTIQHELYGKEASNYTKSKLLGKTVYLEKDVSETDKYGRLLRYVWLEKPTSITESEIRSKMFNAILLINGYAQVATYPPDVKYVDYFTKFQKEARQANVGLWGIGSSSTASSSSSSKTSSSSSSTKSSSSSSKSSSSSSSSSGSSSGSNTSSPSNVKGDRVVYWTPGGKSYHFTKNCPTLSRSKTIEEGPLLKCPKSDPCDVCTQ